MALVNLKCRKGCIGILGRAHLVSSDQEPSVYEGKCNHCKEWTTFRSVKVETKLEPDGQGGFLTVPVVG